MNNTSDNEQDLTSGCPTSAEDTLKAHSTRRRFARNAVVGGAVFLSLGNRSAWGVDDIDGTCMSTSILNSFTGAGFASMGPGHTDQYFLDHDVEKAQLVSSARSGDIPGYTTVESGSPSQTCIVTVEPDSDVTFEGPLGDNTARQQEVWRE